MIQRLYSWLIGKIARKAVKPPASWDFRVCSEGRIYLVSAHYYQIDERGLWFYDSGHSLIHFYGTFSAFTKVREIPLTERQLHDELSRVREKLTTAQERVGKLERVILQVTREAHQAACLPRGIMEIVGLRSAIKKIRGIIETV